MKTNVRKFRLALTALTLVALFVATALLAVSPVCADGPGDRDDSGNRVPMDVSVGDKVLFAKYGGTEIKLDGDKLLILRESDILALIEG